MGECRVCVGFARFFIYLWYTYYRRCASAKKQHPTTHWRRPWFRKSKRQKNKHTNIKEKSSGDGKPTPTVATSFPLPMLSINSVLSNINPEKKTTHKGFPKKEVELIFDFLGMHFCQLRKEHSGLCDWRNLQKCTRRSEKRPKRKHFLLNVPFPVIYRTPHRHKNH